MASPTQSLDLAALALTAGEGRLLELGVAVAPVRFAGESYAVQPRPLPVRLDVARTTGRGWSLRARFSARIEGPCMRCLEPAAPVFEIDSREVHQPGNGEELSSPYVDSEQLDLAGLVRDALVLALPAQLVCRDECAGLCPVCGVNLNVEGPDHAHERASDPRWEKLRELRLE